ncbi:ribonucleases P/MRP protein subunit POP1 [Cydia pomonella]|uniref:ribonucleases P/MRP protein subunit POP1 n=1 Tax=Cydia pomonella TaxID=82600 RepID=UPI002ADDA353|nr:ribonucleases P/MRP protein subunit POP1 [Cydia pomonella]
MAAPEFDAALGGTEELPFSANSLKFATSRSIEIAAMTESILRPSKTKLIFQTLPVHMRRRVMSHNCKRLPRKLREGHLEQLKKSGLPPKQKRPSRKYRRRPGNLLDEYNRRQKRNVWLETHIWHAKRFHMVERWGHRLALAPCDKAFRMCYRATSAHCLLQDISYLTPIQITGPVALIKEMFSSLTNCVCGLGICAQAYVTGKREGTIHLYEVNSYPFGYIGKMNFIWLPTDNQNKVLWLFVHPSQTKQAESALTNMLNGTSTDEHDVTIKKRKTTNQFTEKIKFKVLPGIFNRFQLTGPNSHAILTRTLKCVNEHDTSEWQALLKGKEDFYLKEKCDYWQEISKASSPSQLPPKTVVGLVVKDPRLSRPSHRTKAKYENTEPIPAQSLIDIPNEAAKSPLWDTNIYDVIKKNRLTNGQFIAHITKTQLVPGEVNENDPALQSVPVVLVQRPGSQEPSIKKLGYGSGWDIIIPSGYSLQFWQTFIMFGARSGGLRETESLAFEMGEHHIPPDSEAGKAEEKRIEMELKERYFKLPPSKRVNYAKLGVNSPFICPWKMLLKDWTSSSVDDFFILRDRKLLDQIQNCVMNKKALPQMVKSESCLVAVYIKIKGKGTLKRHAHLCLPQPGDDKTIKTLFEPHHEDPNEKLRKQKRITHITDMKRLRRRKIKLKKHKTSATNGIVARKKSALKEPSEYVKLMRDLWVPSSINTVRHLTVREIIGFITQGGFSFSEAQSCGVGFVAYNALSALLKTGQNKILVRNLTSRKYRLGSLQITVP